MRMTQASGAGVRTLGELAKALPALATMRQIAINTMPPGFLEPARAKAIADIGSLTESAGRLEAIDRAWLNFHERCDPDDREYQVLRRAIEEGTEP